MIKYWSAFSIPEERSTIAVAHRRTGAVAIHESVLDETHAAQRLISSRMVIAFSRTKSFGDAVNRWNKELLNTEEPESEQEPDRTNTTREVEIRGPGLTVIHPEGGYDPRNFYGK
jgi:hypothetical protein